MRRSDFLRLAGVTADDHNSIRRRGQLPFEHNDDEGWGDYTASQAWALCIQARLIEAGLPASTARHMVVFHLDAAWAAMGDETPFLFGRGTLPAAPKAHAELATPIAVFGPLAALMYRTESRRPTQGLVADLRQPLMAIVAINMAEHWLAFLARRNAIDPPPAPKPHR